MDNLVKYVSHDYGSLIKFNPNHDDKGLFASGPGGGADKGLKEMYARIAQPDGGFTYQPKTHEEPSGGYAVSPYPDRSFAKDVKDLTPDDLAQYYHDNIDLFQKEDHFIGGWHDPATGRAFLDVSVVVKTPEEARALAIKHDQIAYFDFQTFKSVTVNKDATSGGVAKKGVLPEWHRSLIAYRPAARA